MPINPNLVNPAVKESLGFSEPPAPFDWIGYNLRDVKELEDLTAKQKKYKKKVISFLQKNNLTKNKIISPKLAELSKLEEKRDFHLKCCKLAAEEKLITANEGHLDISKLCDLIAAETKLINDLLAKTELTAKLIIAGKRAVNSTRK